LFRCSNSCARARLAAGLEALCTRIFNWSAEDKLKVVVEAAFLDDEQLGAFLRNAAEQTAEEDGGAYLARVGQYISNNISFSPINYGYKKLSDLIRVSELFHIDMRKNKSVMYIKDSRK
jgi:hypothetical protein